MEKDLTAYRKSYEKGALDEVDVPQNPWELFQNWFELADASANIEEANAMTLATVDQSLMPKSRVVLLKSFDQEGFRFFTNYGSEKGRDLESNPQCCLSFFWPALEKQVIIKGKAEKLPRQESEEYFHSRPKGSQLGALASHQSSVISNREELENRLKDLEQQYQDGSVPLPDYWGGYLVRPVSFEFWQGRQNRLHDRLLYTPNNDNWKIERLAP
ncbi:MAG: pyridoxamine 5'-phosphate oxidase [Bacteroidota bacterium]|uniref:Pyridoxine/pyridoxamine 5'-phosphate oxidase n=1 Tax=Christiangramia flava JLT2011 TaxID=1229726 RepID=A0A1L7I9L4_9FLAO|nr:pyridoxamine 5'-phosphate oxidase [Christiangramia flava]APU70296.1 Pyridoxamine 5'-phosphate oxidase [Christiangramia flava JLT2011]MEE2772794.1 pyridoxamine 5'-phosphate oxidase [Bacteroidota bacterium]OSS39782.1 Pyridoxamine 5'-phosphate oxidase [Christiangramia flava JLT2011]